MSESRLVEGAGEAGATSFGRDFRLYAVGQAVSIVGDRIALIALVFVVVRLSHAYAPAVGLFYVCNVIPTVAGGLFAGVIADRFDRQRIMIACDLGRALVLTIVPAISALTLWTLYPLVVVLYALTLGFDTTSRAALPDIVPGDRLLGANSVLRGIRAGADFAYAIGGVLVATLGPRLPFFVDAATFVFSAITIVAMRFPVQRRAVAQESGVTAQIAEGVRFQMRQPFLKWSTFVFGLAPFAGGAVFVLVPLYANRVLAHSAGLVGPLGNGAFRFSLLEVAVGAGAVAGSWIAPRLTRRWPSGLVFAAGITGLGAATAALAAVTNLYPALALMVAQGVFNSLFLVPGMTLLQSLTPTEIRGRVMAARIALINTSIALGSAVGGAALVLVPYRSMWLAAGVLIAASSLFLWVRPDVRGQA